MKNVERRDRQLPYISDAEVMEQQMNARRLTQKLNTIEHVLKLQHGYCATPICR